MIKKGTGKHLKQILGSPKLAEMQRTVLRGTAHTLRKTLSMQKKIKQRINETMLNVYVLNKS